MRKPKRSVLIVLSVFWLVLLNLLMQAQQNGTHQHILSNFLGFYAGYLRIQPKDSSQTLFHQHDISLIDSISYVGKAVPRLEIFAILQSTHKNKPVMLAGVAVKEDQSIFKPSKYLVKGSYFEKDDEKSILISHQLAKKLKIKLQQKVLILNGDVQNHLPKDSLFVKGIFQLPSPELNRKQVFIPLKTLQKLFNVPQQISNISLFPPHHTPYHLDKLKNTLQKKLSHTSLEVKTWNENFPELSQTFQMDYWVGYLILSILYLITVLGFWGIVGMLFQEREPELVMLWKLGVRTSQILCWFMTEISILVGVGAFWGILLAFLISKWIVYHPIRLTGEWATALENLGFEPLITYSFELYPLLFQVCLLMSMVILLTFYLRWMLLRLLKTKTYKACKAL